MVESCAFLGVSNSLNCAVNLNFGAFGCGKARGSWAGVSMSGLRALPVYSWFLGELEGECFFLFFFTVLPVLLHGFFVVFKK